MSEWVRGCQVDGFSSVGARTGAIKLAMASTYVGLVVLISSIVGLAILYVTEPVKMDQVGT